MPELPYPMKAKSTTIIILAAGGSKRLGQPKQLLTYKGESLLRRALSCATHLEDAETFVVTGANKETTGSELSGFDVEIVGNERWEEGLATSIAAGLLAVLKKADDTRGCLFMVCDQPHLTTALLQQIIDLSQHSGKGIVAAIYHDTPGTPVFFHRKYFPQLLALRGDEGARKLLKKYPEDLITVPFAEGAIDIDTPDDYKKLTNAD